MLATTPLSGALRGRRQTTSDLEVVFTGLKAHVSYTILWTTFLGPKLRFGFISTSILELECVRMHYRNLSRFCIALFFDLQTGNFSSADIVCAAQSFDRVIWVYVCTLWLLSVKVSENLVPLQSM